MPVNNAVGAIFGQRRNSVPCLISYVSKTLNEAQVNSTVLEKELLVFIVDVVLKCLFSNKNAKARLIRWIPLVQKFNLNIKDKKGVENVVTNHLSKILMEHTFHIHFLSMRLSNESLLVVNELA